VAFAVFLFGHCVWSVFWGLKMIYVIKSRGTVVDMVKQWKAAESVYSELAGPRELFAVRPDGSAVLLRREVK